jgi:Tol biopolymer transport system component/DNA-binding winged helix-turn-helix (wHTH) protein
MSDLAAHSYEFGDIRVDVARFQVTRAGEVLELEPKALAVLIFLIERRDRLVLKEEILDGVWRDTFVTPNALTRVIAQLRKTLGDDAQEARVIETVPRKGYRFLPDVVVADNGNRAIQPLPRIAATSAPRSDRPPVAPPMWRIATPLLLGAFLALSGWLWMRSGVAAPPAISELVQLTTTGYEADPALSPDGKRLAFTSEENGANELYVRPVGAGNRVKVTDDRGRNTAAAWSPDGEFLAYQSGARGGIWIVPALGGPPRQVAPRGSDPAWAPNGKTIAFSTFEGGIAERGVIMTVPVDGGDAAPVTRPGAPRGGHRRPEFSRDGRRIAFTVFDGTRGSSVWTTGLEGSEPTLISAGVMPNQLAFTPDDSALCWSGFGPASSVGLWCSALAARAGDAPAAMLQGVSGTAGLSIARDGTIAYAVNSSDSDLWSVPLASDGQASGEPVQVVRDTSRNTYPAFSPDGQHLAYVSWRPGTRFEAWLLNMRDGSTSLLSQGPDDESFPTWMPDNQTVVVTASNDNGRRVMRTSIETRQSQAVSGLPSELSNVSLSPDGRELAYHVTNENGGLSPWVVPFAGGEPRRLTSADRSAGYPSWSPDGQRLALEVDHNGKTHVWIVNRDGSGMRQVTSGVGQHWPHSWAPDSDRIAYAGQRDGVWNVWTVSASTGAMRQLTRFTTQTGYVRYPAWSPLNDRIVFERSTETSKLWTGKLTSGASRSQ